MARQTWRDFDYGNYNTDSTSGGGEFYGIVLLVLAVLVVAALIYAATLHPVNPFLIQW
jgi:hypothetical protein